MTKAEQNITLLSPLGLSPGLLFTALKQVNPTKLLLITSPIAAGTVENIINKAGFTGEVQIFTVDDPFTCFNDVGRISQEISPHAKDEEWIINLTGGTTALQFIVQKIAEELSRDNKKITYAAMIDRRKPEEQRANPWVTGEMLVIKI